MTPPFRALSLYADAPRVAWPTEGYDPTEAPGAVWPTPWGAPARTGRAGGALGSDRWSVAWQASLDDAARPDAVLVGDDVVVVSGAESRRIWDGRGQATGQLGRGPGACFIDAAGRRLLAHDVEGGLCTYLLPTGVRDATILLLFPTGFVTREILQGPRGLVLVSARASSQAPPPSVVVQTVGVLDWDDKSEEGILYGLDPLAGIVREEPGRVRAAAARSGPVLATTEGILWCDWQLAPICEHREELVPLALSVDAAGRAHFLFERAGIARFSIVPPGAAPVCDVELPWPPEALSPPPLLTRDGDVFLTPPHHRMALSAMGQVRWHEARRSRVPGTVTSDGFLLLDEDGELSAIAPDGRGHPIWRAPAPLLAPPVLAQGRLHLATAETLLVLAPAGERM